MKEKIIRGRKHRNGLVTACKLTAPDPNPSSIDESSSGEDHLEDLLMKKLDSVYSEALSDLISLGYDETLALHALLSHGQCLGSSDAKENVVTNAVSFLKSGGGAAGGIAPAAFPDLRRLEEHSLDAMVCLLQQVRPRLSRSDAMSCLLASGLHVGKAASIELQVSSPRREINVVAAVMKSLESLSIDEEDGDDPKDEMIIDLAKQIRELEQQVEERKEWAQQKAMQAAKRVSNDLMELKVLRMEREESLRGKKGKQGLDEATMKKLAEMEGALRKASSELDQANVEVHQLEVENAEIRAELEACKLSAAESASACLEVARRERKCLKRLLAWEKQRERLQSEVAQEREGIVRVNRQLEEVYAAQKKAEINCKQVMKAKEQALVQLSEERRAKEATEASIKRKHEALRRKIEMDSQRQKDDIHRLEEELSRLQASMSTPTAIDHKVPKHTKGAKAKPTQAPNKPKNVPKTRKHNRECIICMDDEVSVVFLPCAHQVVCTSCNEDHERRAKMTCPCCNLRIEERIHVYGASS